jgi:hypothetical protein
VPTVEVGRKLRDRKRKQGSSSKDSDSEDYKKDFKKFLRILKFKHRKNVMIRQAYSQMGSQYKNLCDMMLYKEQE